ncbi:VOC family protein [Luteimonas sp. BDR2-5]|uniref:VOC family protein n=1 Tax=Proluteimonas luteida TaxID=2878685 RepID=UPI001E596738|nr:VOC family protein [Luteimonas sp. BDR2-5]MCD9029306.1 VOC family protein [Luteimonas sp. BDR2-5]
MSHRSRLSTFVLDCEVDDLAPHVEFWSRAFGKPVAPVDQDGDGKYAELETSTDEPILLLQKVDHASRIHLDIETDDVDAEADRLEGLGARKVAFVKRWWVMEAPSGHRFCVVRQQRTPFGPHTNTWEDDTTDG